MRTHLLIPIHTIQIRARRGTRAACRLGLPPDPQSPASFRASTSGWKNSRCRSTWGGGLATATSVRLPGHFLEPVYNLFRISTAKARTTICWLVLSFLSQFFQRRRHFSSQPKDRSTTNIVSAAPRKCAVRCVSPLPPRLPAGSAPPWQRVSRCIPHPPAHSAPGSGWPGAGQT